MVVQDFTVILQQKVMWLVESEPTDSFVFSHEFIGKTWMTEEELIVSRDADWSAVPAGQDSLRERALLAIATARGHPELFIANEDPPVTVHRPPEEPDRPEE
jgi:hypothetical protein